MKLNSTYFDRIRVKPDEKRKLRAESPVCDFAGCREAATHRAPKGRLREREYWRFCLEHAREYNQSYNFFAGMSDDAVAQYQKDSVTGHRPTWKMGMSGKAGAEGADPRARRGVDGAADPFGVFEGSGGFRPRVERVVPERRAIRNVERKALDALGLEISANSQEIKARFKLLVKRHHPDANGGDRSCEDKLREIIQAYNYLKTAGLC